jgi:indole-3-glycerol phosphate synthase
MNILAKKEEVAVQKNLTSIEELRQMPFYQRNSYSLKSFLLDKNKNGIIAEHKRKSPSKGTINGALTLKEVVLGYEKAGASACSILTDESYFGGHPNDLIEARSLVQIPLLRKDFMIDTYQIEQAKAWGADVILLIAACLTNEQIKELSTYAHQLGLEVLLEVHNKEELIGNLLPTIDVIGVNNRNLKTFDVSIDTSIEVGKHIPNQYIKISESGIEQAESIHMLKKHGFQGFLIGEYFMKHSAPGEILKEFANKI